MDNTTRMPKLPQDEQEKYDLALKLDEYTTILRTRGIDSAEAKAFMDRLRREVPEEYLGVFEGIRKMRWLFEFGPP